MHLFGESEAALNRVGDRQHGTVHRRQATACGIRKKAIAGYVRRGTWVRLHPSVFALRPVTFKGAVLAAIMDAGLFAVAADRTAAHLDSLVPRSPRTITLAIVGRHHNAARRLGVRVTRPRHLTWTDVHFHQTIPLTKPHETLAAMAAHTDPDELEAMVALALRRGQTSRSDWPPSLQTHPADPASRCYAMRSSNHT